MDIQKQLNWKFRSIVVSTGFQTNNPSMNEDRTGGIWYSSRTGKIEDHRYKKFSFPESQK